MASKSNTFYRLAKKFEDYGKYQIYDFHTAVNGFMWYQYHEAELDNGIQRCGYHGEIKRLGYGESAKQRGNDFYRKLKLEGYELVGIYEQDVFGKEIKIK